MYLFNMSNEIQCFFFALYFTFYLPLPRAYVGALQMAACICRRGHCGLSEGCIEAFRNILWDIDLSNKAVFYHL